MGPRWYRVGGCVRCVLAECTFSAVSERLQSKNMFLLFWLCTQTRWGYEVEVGGFQEFTWFLVFKIRTRTDGNCSRGHVQFIFSLMRSELVSAELLHCPIIGGLCTKKGVHILPCSREFSPHNCFIWNPLCCSRALKRQKSPKYPECLVCLCLFRNKLR